MLKRKRKLEDKVQITSKTLLNFNLPFISQYLLQPRFKYSIIKQRIIRIFWVSKIMTQH